MFQVFYNNQTLYQPGDTQAILLEPTLQLALSKSGAFTAKIPPTNPLYDKVKELTGEIRVERDGKALFHGRILTIEVDFTKNKEITCEGELSFLLDTVQEPAEFHDISVRAFLETLIAKHNSQVGASGVQFKIGQVTVHDPNDSLYRYTNWETTLEAINDKLVDRLGGFLRVRREGSVRYLDYLTASDHTSAQVIEFGENLLDYTENLHTENLCTRVIPLGKRLETSTIAALEEYITIKTINGGKPYVESAEAIKTYGVITRTVRFDDVTIPANLKKKAEKYLKDTQFADVSLELSAVDLHLLNRNIEAFQLGDEIRVVSPPHGMDRRFMLSKLTIALDHPESSTITLGTDVKAGLSEKSVSENRALVERIESLPKQSETLKLARDNATALITAATTGHVVTRANEILIMDTGDTKTARKVWRWNMNGLGYSKTGYNGRYGTAITMDGAIVADYITTGTLKADLIRTGTLKDKQGNISWNMATGDLSAKRLSINSPNFTLTSSGYLTAKSATITGTVITETSDTKVRMGSGNLSIYYNNKQVGLVGGNGFAKSNTIAGLNFDLDPDGDYMTWAVLKRGGTSYDMVWTYARSSFGGFSAGMLNAGADIDMRYHKLRNVVFEEGGLTGTLNFVNIGSVQSDGRVGSWYNNCYMQFKNGLLIGGRF